MKLSTETLEVALRGAKQLLSEYKKDSRYDNIGYTRQAEISVIELECALKLAQIRKD